MNSRTIHQQIQISIGIAELSIDLPEHLQENPDFEVRGLALIGHPHPLMGGTMDNKVAQTIAKTMTQLGYVSVRPNFRGVGLSEGLHDDGAGETDDMEEILAWMQAPNSWSQMTHTQHHTWTTQAGHLPIVLGGFSFGTFVNANLAKRLADQARDVQRLVLVGSAAGKWDMPLIAPNSIVIHGELDETIPIVEVFNWLRLQDMVVHVIPDADHFFHRKLHLIRDTIMRLWDGQ
jgi:uncharacterized protein